MAPIGIYLRVSTEEQATEGYSLPEQERVCRAYCTTRGWNTARIYSDEGLSAFKDKVSDRPGLQQMLEDVRLKKLSGVVVHKLDRFFRRTRLLIETVEELLDVLNVPFVSVSEQIDFSTPAGRVMLANLGAFAEYYSRNLSTETAKGLAGKARAGDWVGPVPFGYQREGKTLVPSPDADIVVSIFNMYVGDNSFTTIADKLNQRGIVMRHWRDGEKMFGRESIRSIICNPAYRGLVTCNGVVSPGNHPALVSDELWLQAEAIRRDRSETKNTPSVRGAGGLLSEYAYCAYCNARLWYHRSGNKATYYYRCGKRREYGEHACDSKMMRAERADGLVTELAGIFIIPESLQEVILGVAQSLSAPVASVEIDTDRVRRQLVRLRSAFLAGDEDLPETVYFAEKKRLEAMLVSNKPPESMTTFGVKAAMARLNDMKRAIEEGDVSERRRYFRALFDRVWLSVSTGIDRFAPTPAYAALIEATAQVRGGCLTGIENPSYTIPPRVYLKK